MSLRRALVSVVPVARAAALCIDYLLLVFHELDEELEWDLELDSELELEAEVGWGWERCNVHRNACPRIGEEERNALAISGSNP